MKSYEATDIRSFALAGHGGSGKTSIGEAIAYLAGLNTRLGSVTDGSSLLDFEPEERDRGGSLSTSVLACEYGGLKLHVLDTPGDGDFIHDAYLALQAVDNVVLVVSAVDGVETATEKMSQLAGELGLGRMVFINKLDRDRASHTSILDELGESLGVEPVLLQLPIGEADGFRGVVDLVTRRAYLYEGDGGKGKEVDVPAAMMAEVEAAVEAMVEAVATTDDELLEHYLDVGELTDEEVKAGLHKAIAKGALVPVVLGSATRNIGVDRLLTLASALEGPTERAFTGLDPAGRDETLMIQGDPSGELVAICFKTLIDPFMGQLSVFRAIRGTATTESQPMNIRTESQERFSSIIHLQGKKHVGVDRVTAGDIFAVPKLKGTQTGDTVSTGKPIAVVWREAAPPMISYVLKPLTRADEDKVRGALDKILAEDKGLVQSFDSITKEIVLAGRGANHIAMACQKMKRRYGVSVELGTPTIPYHETISANADVRYRHKKQTGGAGQFGEVAIRVSPNERGAGFEFVNATVGGVIPSSLIPSVEKGVRAQLEQGILAGFPVVDVKVVLYDGKSHPVDSKDIAFQIAGRQAVKRAVLEARPVLLEPVYQVEIVVPEENVGDIMGDLNTRRARIQSMEGRGRNSVVKALVPLAEMLSYSPSLKSMTGGRGTYSMQLASYEPVPYSMQDKLVEQVNRIKAGADDD